MNTQELFDAFFDRIFHTISSYMYDECQFQNLVLFSAFLWTEFRQIWTATVTRPPPAVSFRDRALPYSSLPHTFLSPCNTFYLHPARCQAVLLDGTECGRRAITPLTLCRAHAEAWLLPGPFPYDWAAGEWPSPSFTFSLLTFSCVFLTWVPPLTPLESAASCKSFWQEQ